MKNLKKGFTLVELLIVIAIIGILAVAFLPSVMGAPSKARDAQRIEQVNKIANFLSLKYAVDGYIPAYQYLTKTGTAGLVITENLADFGGVFPLDPDPNSCVQSSCSTSANKGTYMIHKATSGSDPSGSYAFSVIARVENLENGNSSANPGASNSYVLSDSGVYYRVLIQK